MAHSIPESNALIIRTPLGTVLHTGDWKLDPTPVIGPPTDEAKLGALGDEGCLALIGDSTNAVREGRSPSEMDVARTLRELIGGAQRPHRDHHLRLQRGAHARRRRRRRRRRPRGRGGRPRHGPRRAGRARERLSRGDQRIPRRRCLRHLPPDKVVALCTGSQGEPRAALARIAEDQHPEVTFDKGDMVIFSSRTIPGNEKAVGRVINGLVRQGIEVITDRTHLVHVSGHPRRAEMEEMYRWVRPRIAIPVHGEALHLSEHAKLARAVGVPEVVLCGDGDLVRLAPDAGVIDEVPAARLYKDGALLISAEGRTVADRRRLSFAGIVVVALALIRQGRAAGRPGCRADRHSGGRMPTSNRCTRSPTRPRSQTFESLPKARRRDPQAVEEAVKRAVRAAIADHWQKKPICLVQVLVV